MRHAGRHTFLKTITVPDGTDGVHVPERISEAPGMLVTLADIYASVRNKGTVYVGWFVSAVKDHETGIELLARDIATIVSPLKIDDRGNTQIFDLYELWVTGTDDGDGVSVFTW